MPTFAKSLLIHLTEVFSVPTSVFLKYESTTWLPWFVKRYILRKKIERPPPIIEKVEYGKSA